MGELMEASNRQDGLLKIAPGLFGYDREIVKILRWLDAFFDSVGDAINAREILFPSLISLSTLNKIGYVDSFSDTLIYPSCYLPICKDIVKKKEGLKDVALTPAACFHIYPMYANNSFDDLENAIVTTQGKVFRYETRPRSKWRLYEFTVREFVFIGNLTFVTRMVEAFKSVSQEFAMQVGLPVVIESATDPFFLLLDNWRIRSTLKSRVANFGLRAHGRFRCPVNCPKLVTGPTGSGFL